MKKAVFVIIGLLMCILQCTVTWRFSLGWHNYGVAVCIITALSVFDGKIGIITGIICGFFLDCIQGRFIGISLFMLLFTAIIVMFLSRGMNGKNMIAVVLLTLFVTFFTEFAQYWIYFVVNGTGNISFALTKLIFPQAFINAVCSVPIYFLIKLIWKKFKMQNDRWGY